MNPPQREPASPWRVVGTGLTLFVFLAALAWVGLGLVSSPVDGAQEQREIFGDAGPPFGLHLDSAVRLPTGDVLVRFTRGGDAGATGPVELAFLRYRSHAAADAVFRPPEPSMGGPGGPGQGGGPPQDPGMRLKEWEKDRSFDWHVTMKRDEIGWGEWSTKYLIERSFKKDDGWYEEARVDLRRPGRPLVLFAHWPRETEVPESDLRTLLRAIVVPPLEK